MKVIMVSPLAYPYTGGVETHVLEVSKKLVDWSRTEEKTALAEVQQMSDSAFISAAELT